MAIEDPRPTLGGVDQESGAIAFDRAADYYDRTRGYPDGVQERVADLLCQAAALGPESVVLDIGVGTGRIALPLAARVNRVVGVDLSRPMLARLVSKSEAQSVVPVLADARALPFPEARFDAVLGVHVFHLLPAWKHVLGEVRRVLAPEGRLVVAEDARILPELWELAYAGIRPPSVVGVPHGSADFPLAYGFRVAAEPHSLSFPLQLSLASFMETLEDRLWSATWRLSDAEHARLCANMRAAIISRYGSLEAELDLEREFCVRTFVVAER